MSTVTITPNGDGWHTVRSAYDLDVVRIIKTLVPAHWRRWRPDLRAWHVADHCVTELALQLDYYGHRVVEPGQRRGTDRQHGTDSANWADVMFEAVGSSRVEPVHRALVRVLHPDTPTGDTALAQQLNAARDRRPVRTAA